MPTYTSGPLAGVQYTPRFPQGVVLVNTEKEEVIIYDLLPEAETPTFVPRPRIELREYEKSERGKDEPYFDFLTYDEERMGKWSL